MYINLNRKGNPILLNGFYLIRGIMCFFYRQLDLCVRGAHRLPPKTTSRINLHLAPFFYVYRLPGFLFRLYYRYCIFMVNYVWYFFLLIQYKLPYAAVLFALPSSHRFWLVLLVGLLPSAWEAFFSCASRGLRFLALRMLCTRYTSENFEGISPDAPPLFLHHSLLQDSHIHSVPIHLIHPNDFIDGDFGPAIICALTWVLASIVTSARLLYALAQFFRPVGTFLFVPSLYLLLLFVLPLTLIGEFANSAYIIPACFLLPLTRIIGATRRFIAVKISRVVARWFSIPSLHTSGRLKDSTESLRASFVENLPIGPPPHFRLIDCQETIRQGRIFLVDWQYDLPYTAISHTWGLPVYSAFNCPCATIGFSRKVRWDPRLSCLQTSEHWQTIKDIFCMCKRLYYVAEVNYIWHDGVCIAQYDETELYDTMKHMAWIYGNAKETVIFFDYVGQPLMPAAPPGEIDSEMSLICFMHEWLQVLRGGTRPYPSQTDAVRQLLPRWFCRAWTYQEALVSPKRRYCIRLGDDLASCWTWADFDRRLKEWDEDESVVKVLEEEKLVSVLRNLAGEMLRLMAFSVIAPGEARFSLPFAVYTRLMLMIMATELRVWPHDPRVLLFEASNRECKHKEDRLNSMLGLAGIRNFVVRLDESPTLEGRTIEFLSNMGQKGLASAMCVVNSVPKTQPWNYSWVPDLDRPVRVAASGGWGGDDDNRHEDGWISSMEIEREGGGGVLKMKVGMATCVPVHLSTGNQNLLQPGCLILHSRILPQHTAILFRKRLDVRHLGVMEELGTCIMECEQHNRLYEEENVQLFLVCSPWRLRQQMMSSAPPVDARGGVLFWMAPHRAFLLNHDRLSGWWFKAGFLSSVSTGLVEALRYAPLAERHFCVH